MSRSGGKDQKNHERATLGGMNECERVWIQYRDSRDVREGLDEVVLIYCSGTFLGNWQGGKNSHGD